MEKTTEVGIYLKDGRYLVRTTAKDPHTGRMTYRKKLLPHGASLVDAINLRSLMKAEIMYRSAPEKEEPITDTVGSFALSWLSSNGPTMASSTLAHVGVILDRWLLPVLGDILVRDLARAHVKHLVSAMDAATQEDGSSYSKATRRTWWVVCKGLLKDLCAEHGLADVTLRVNGPRRDGGTKRERRALSADQLHAFVEASKVSARYLEILVLATTGMRVGELYGLHWQDIDWQDDDGRGSIRVCRSAVNGIVEDTTKTGYARVVPLDPSVRELLLELHGTSVERIGLVFPSDVGTARSSSGVRKQMKAISEYANMPFRVTPQTLRRTVNTCLVEASNEIVARQILGHSAPAMTHHYAGSTTGGKREALTRALGPKHLAPENSRAK